jgi:catechol 2,3-dioxygenase
MTRFPSAAFVSAGGYHHHLGLNTWRGEGVPPAPEGIVGLRHWTIVLDDEAEVDAVRDRLAGAGVDYDVDEGRLAARDPWNIAVVLTAASR